MHCDGKYPKSFQLYLARAGQLRRWSVLDQNCKNGRNIQTLTFLLFFSILGWYPTLRNEPKLRYNRWIRLMNCFICGLPPEDTKSLWHLMTILYWLSCKIPHLIIEAEINSKFKQFCWHWHTGCSVNTKKKRAGQLLTSYNMARKFKNPIVFNIKILAIKRAGKCKNYLYQNTKANFWRENSNILKDCISFLML